jgi:hypothetical protein
MVAVSEIELRPPHGIISRQLLPTCNASVPKAYSVYHGTIHGSGGPGYGIDTRSNSPEPPHKCTATRQLTFCAPAILEIDPSPGPRIQKSQYLQACLNSPAEESEQSCTCY